MNNLTHTVAKKKLFAGNVESEAIVTKLMPTTRQRPHSQNNDDSRLDTNLSTLARVTQQTTQSINDVENIFEVLPDTELAMQILVSSIMSPNDMRTPELTWSATGAAVQPEVSAKIIDLLKDYFEKEWGLKEKLQSFLEDALFKTGSYPLMIVPENSLNNVINGTGSLSMESIKSYIDDNNVCSGIGLLGAGAASLKNKKTKQKGPTVKPGLESMFVGPGEISASSRSEIDENVFVTDNYSAVCMPKVAKRARSKLVNQAIGKALGTVSVENDTVSLDEVASMFYERKNTTQKSTLVLKSKDTAGKQPVGHPMDLKLPSDCIITVHAPSDPTDHVGYYVLLDMYGNPISNARDSGYYKELTELQAARNKDTSSNILSHVNDSLFGARSELSVDDIHELQDTYARAMEKDLLERLRNGVYGNDVEISNASEVYRIMFARKCAEMNTQVLYVPAELMVYVAFDYNRSGIGRSLLEKSKMLSSIRSILLFSNTMAAINNSINQRRLNIELGAEDYDPESTVDMIMGEYAKKESGGLPLASTNPMDIIDGIRRAATSVVVTGNPNWPDTKVDVENIEQRNVVVDNLLDESMRDRHLLSIGITPELVDSSTTIDFAVEAINRNLMYNKRIANYQMRAQVFLAEIVSKYSLNSGNLLAEIIRIIQAGVKPGESSVVQDGIDEGIVDEKEAERIGKMSITELIADFFEHLAIELPDPDNTKITNQIEQLENYDRALDKVLEAYFNDEVLTEDGAENARVQVTIFKGYFLRRYVIENNILPEVHEMFDLHSTDPQILASLEKHSKLSKSISDIVNKMTDRNKDESGDSAGDDDTNSRW